MDFHMTFSKLYLSALLCSASFFASATQTIAIVGAMDEEISALLPKLKNPSIETIAGQSFHKGQIYDQSVVITRSGVGKVNAAVTTTLLIEEFGADKLIFTGIAGALSPKLSPTDVVISTSLVQHDVDLSAFGSPLGLIDGYKDRYFQSDTTLQKKAFEAATGLLGSKKVFRGIIATGDQFIADKKLVTHIYNEFNAMAIEMEGAAIAQVANKFNKPFVVIRTISDKADGSAHLDYPLLKQKTADNSVSITLEMLKTMKNKATGQDKGAEKK
jgi:adenosylhomocysteine nucleosidase